MADGAAFAQHKFMWCVRPRNRALLARACGTRCRSGAVGRPVRVVVRIAFALALARAVLAPPYM